MMMIKFIFLELIRIKKKINRNIRSYHGNIDNRNIRKNTNKYTREDWLILL